MDSRQSWALEGVKTMGNLVRRDGTKGESDHLTKVG